MRIQYYTATSLDGFIADPDNALDWLLELEQDAVVEEQQRVFLAGVGALAMGSTTYEWILREHLRGDPRRWPYEQPTWVFTTRQLPGVEGHDIRFVRGDVAPVVEQVRAEVAEGTNLWLVGGGELAGRFIDAGLLDDLLLAVAPVTLGAGAPLLPRRVTSPALRLVEVTRGGPFALLHYQVQSGPG